MSVPTSAPTADDSDTGVEISAAELDDALQGEHDHEHDEHARKAVWPDGGPQVAGVALVAANTGRVLMIQRALDPDDESDPARGTWEFPGGHLEAGDATDLHGAMREWAEEVGRPLPTGATHAHRWENGLYRGHVLVVPAEDLLDLDADRTVDNPDDDAEQVAWWDPADARKNPALRKECRDSPWQAIARAAAEHPQSKAAHQLPLEVKAGGAGPHTPPQGVQAAARRALDLIEKGRAGQNFTGVGRKRAADLARGAKVSTATAKRMHAYFSRHEADRGAHWGKAGEETPGYVAWMAWGGDPGRTWARKIVGAAESGEKSAEPSDPWSDLLDGVEVKDRKPDSRPVANTGRPEGPAWASRSSSAPPSVAGDKKGSGKKRKVASKAGENRYGLPIGTELGKARDKNAEDAQKDQGAQNLYEQLRKADPAQHRELLDKMKPEDLQKLSRLLYSSRSSVPAIVAARIAVANALKRKGLDVNDSGGLGRAARPGRATPAPRKPGRAGDRVKGDSVDAGKISDAEWDQLRREGWKGRPGDAAERLYRPATKEADMDIEVKRTTTKPSKTGAAQNAGKTIGKAKGDDGDEYPIRTIGDVATALKRAKSIKDPERKREVMAHIRAGAKKINAGNMVPSDDDSDKGTGKNTGKGGPPPWVKKKSADGEFESTDLVNLVDEIDRKVMSPNPNATRLRHYWAHGAGRAKWSPGTPGDFERLRNQVRKYIPKRMLNGFVANVHKLATGEWPGKNAHRRKSADESESDGLITATELKVAFGDDADDEDMSDGDPVTAALDSYGDMADSVTSAEEYEQQLATQVDWDLEADGRLVETVDPHAERGPRAGSRADSDVDDDVDEVYDPSVMLAELADESLR